ncbi:MAG: Inositol-monophosphatase [candidate division NC10 bacterium]|jgi:myo-inositol-1(or 4)-monophosphatase|nr:Inositol-monophosphatase [candidate division NC10 bacterium]
MSGATQFRGSTVRQFGGSGAQRGHSVPTIEPLNRRTVERFSAETRAAINAARAAGELLLARAGRAHDIRLKSAKDPVTEVDVAAERCIRQTLGRQFPEIGFVGEEGGTIEGPNGRWIVDPLDGTIAFVTDLPFFSVLIALEREGLLRSGVIYVPRLRELFVAERGRGAWLNGRRLHVSARTRLVECVVALWHDDSVWSNRGLRERIAALALRVRNVRIFGAGYALANVAAGRLDAYWEQSAKPWDVAAGALLVEEAGGRVTDGRGRSLDLGQPTILASNGHIHRRMVAALEPSTAARSGRT